MPSMEAASLQIFIAYLKDISYKLSEALKGLEEQIE